MCLCLVPLAQLLSVQAQSRGVKGPILNFLFMYVFVYLFAAPMACRSSQARDRTHATAVARAAEWQRSILFFICLFLCFRATPMANGGSQARGRIGATAMGLHHSHSNMGSEPRL